METRPELIPINFLPARVDVERRPAARWFYVLPIRCGHMRDVSGNILNDGRKTNRMTRSSRNVMATVGEGYPGRKPGGLFKASLHRY
jgi:hypothetical protein